MMLNMGIPTGPSEPRVAVGRSAGERCLERQQEERSARVSHRVVTLPIRHVDRRTTRSVGWTCTPSKVRLCSRLYPWTTLGLTMHHSGHRTRCLVLDRLLALILVPQRGTRDLAVARVRNQSRRALDVDYAEEWCVDGTTFIT